MLGKEEKKWRGNFFKIFFFSVITVIISVTCQIHQKISYFTFWKCKLLFTILYFFLCVFHYFGPHSHPASPILTLFSPLVFSTQQLKLWFGTKAANIDDFGHSKYLIGHQSQSILAHIPGGKKIFWRIGENWELGFLPIQWSSILR